MSIKTRHRTWLLKKKMWWHLNWIHHKMTNKTQKLKRLVSRWTTFSHIFILNKKKGKGAKHLWQVTIKRGPLGIILSRVTWVIKSEINRLHHQMKVLLTRFLLANKVSVLYFRRAALRVKGIAVTLIYKAKIIARRLWKLSSLYNHKLHRRVSRFQHPVESLI